MKRPKKKKPVPPKKGEPVYPEERPLAGRKPTVIRQGSNPLADSPTNRVNFAKSAKL